MYENKQKRFELVPFDVQVFWNVTWSITYLSSCKSENESTYLSVYNQREISTHPRSHHKLLQSSH